MTSASQWRRCSACKQPIEYGSEYWVCSVSTCNRKRTGLAFCTVSCWEVHLPVARHREAWAEDRRAPASAAADAQANPATRAPRESKRILPAARAPRESKRILPPARAPRESKRILPPARAPRESNRILPAARAHTTRPAPKDEPALEALLIVASHLKDYVKARSGFSTSDRVLDPLSELVRKICDQAIKNAERDGRRTILDRDIPRG